MQIAIHHPKAFAFGLLAAMTQAGAAPPSLPYHSHATGTQLVRDMLADPAKSSLNSVRRERAMGYIDGVMDATAGLRWCPAGKKVSHELNYFVVEDMAGMKPDQLQGDAAALVLAVLAREYPCNPSNATAASTGA